MNNAPEKDQYSCYQCGRSVITINNSDRHAPIFTRCIGLGCDGLMHSNRHERVDIIGKQPQAEWIHPGKEQYDRLNAEQRQRVDHGYPLLVTLNQSEEEY